VLQPTRKTSERATVSHVIVFLCPKLKLMLNGRQLKTNHRLHLTSLKHGNFVNASNSDTAAAAFTISSHRVIISKVWDGVWKVQLSQGNKCSPEII
jgi:hypothetical protein